MPELEDIATRRDYKMKAHFQKKCAKCGGYLWLYRYKGIKLRCMHTDCLNVEEVPRICTFCGYVDTFEVTTCKICEPLIRNITQLEVTIETIEKGLKKLSRNIKAGKINKEVHDMMYDEYTKEVLICQKKLGSARIKRIQIIEKHLESPTK